MSSELEQSRLKADRVALALENGAFEVVVSRLRGTPRKKAKALTWPCRNTGMADPK
jgi:hypothetical protein